MLSVYRTLSVRYLRQRWTRASLIVASIALGVATLVATASLNETMNKAVHVAANPLAAPPCPEAARRHCRAGRRAAENSTPQAHLRVTLPRGAGSYRPSRGRPAKARAPRHQRARPERTSVGIL